MQTQMDNQSLVHVIVGIFITIIVTSVLIITLVEGNVEGESQVNYENTIATCEAANPVREAVVLATRTAANHAQHGNDAYARAARKILDEPYTGHSGARNCQKAIAHP